MIFRQVYVGSLNLLNCIRILLSPPLRRAEVIYCKDAGAWGRAVFSRRIRIIPDHSFVPLTRTNFADSRAAEIFLLSHDRFRHEEDRYLRRFLEQAMGASVFDAVVLVMDHDVMAAEMDGLTGIVLPLSPFLTNLRDRYRTSRREIVWGFGQGRVIRLVRRLVSHSVRIASAVGVSAARAIQPRRAVSPLPVASVLSFRGGSTWEQRHDLAWLPSSTRELPLIFEYAQPRYALSRTFLAELAARGIRIVETHNRKRRIPGGDTWHPGWTFLVRSVAALGLFVKDLAGAAFRARPWLSVWRATQWVQFQMLLAERTDYYSTFNVKAEFIGGFTRAEPAHSDALARLGGASLVAQYSAWTDHFGSHTSAATFHLHFGRAVRCWNLPFQSDFSLMNGFSFKAALADGHETVSSLKRQFQASGIRRSLCFLDEGYLENEGADITLALYQHLLTKLLAEPDFGLIIKPKNDEARQMLEQRLPDLYFAAQASGRLMTLDRNHYAGHAARCADLTVGILGTAPLESAVLGGRAIYLSLHGYVPPFMALIKHNIYGMIDEATAAIERFFQSPDGADVGLHPEEFLQTVDHYRDDQGAVRIEYLMTAYLNEIRKGRSRQQAIDATIAGYSARWPPCATDGQAVY